MNSSHPAFAALAPWLSGSIDAMTLAELNACAASRQYPPRSDSGATIRFVSPAGSPSGADYEPEILLTGAVPTRTASRHDAFNALCWIAFPAFKRACNALHAAQLAEVVRSTRSTERGAMRDALTLLDESGVIVLCADSSLADLLVRREWKALFVDRRAEAMNALRFLVCGHALHEKLLAPYLAITGRALVIPVPASLLEREFDAQREFADESAARLLRTGITTTQIPPLPLAGIPGWDPGNEAAGFYDDASVFRPSHPATVAGSMSTSAHSASAPAALSSSAEP